MTEIKAYSPQKADDFITLLRECLDHYEIEPATTKQERRFVEILDSERHMSCLLAYLGGKPVGFATWLLTFPAGADTAIYMKELFVSSGVRGKGVGRALLAEIFRLGKAEGCSRIDWQTDASNQASQAFYDHLNAPLFEKVTYRVAAQDFDHFIDRLAIDPTG